MGMLRKSSFDIVFHLECPPRIQLNKALASYSPHYELIQILHGAFFIKDIWKAWEYINSLLLWVSNDFYNELSIKINK